ncbi:MAG: acyltransferase [Gemmatimonadetes bacterium]|nr:acyltransferase [Gemmatimonadota bacterium]
MGAAIGETPATSVEGHPPARQHLPVLDGLRGVAILLVLLTHAVALPLEPATTGLDVWAHAIARVGWTGVDLFFVLSGFLITGILLDTRDEPRRWSRFYARRALRIFPLYYGVLIAIFVVLPRLVAWSEPQYHTLQANQTWYWAYAVNFLEVVSHGKGVPLNTVHFWSLSIEEQFYIFWPFVVWACRPKTLFKIGAVVLILGLTARIWLMVANPLGYDNAAWVITPVRLDGLMMGAVLAVAARSKGGLPRLRELAWPAAIGGMLAIALIGIAHRGFVSPDPVVGTIGLPLLAFTYGAVLVLALTARPGDLIDRALRGKMIRSWGRYSYGVYVFHYLIIGALLWNPRLAFYQHESAWLGGSKLPAVLLFALLAAALSFGVAWVSYNVYERRFLSLKRYFEREPVKTGASLAEPAPQPEPGV